MNTSKLYILTSIIFMACSFLSSISNAETKSNSVTINGTTYNSCTIDVTASTLELGDHPASRWGNGSNSLDHSGQTGSRDFIINISECDVGTVIKVKGQGPNGGNGYLWWLKNQFTGGPENLYVSIALMNKGSDSEFVTLPLNETQRTYMTVSESDAIKTTQLKLRTAFRRIDTNNVPIGKFSSTFTVTFTFE